MAKNYENVNRIVLDTASRYVSIPSHDTASKFMGKSQYQEVTEGNGFKVRTHPDTVFSLYSACEGIG